VLAVTLDDLRRVGEKYLKTGNASTALITAQSNQAIADKLMLESHHL